MTIDYIPCDKSNYYTSGRSLDSINYIVIHYTANNGDTARNNGKYFQRSGCQASANYFVDPNEVICSVKDEYAAWHCGGSIESNHHPLRGICTNKNSIGIELCSIIQNGKYAFKKATVNNAITLVKELMAKYHIDADHVVRHYDVTGKNCPAPFVEDESKWKQFKNKLVANEVKEEKKVTYDEFKAFMQKYEQERANQQVSDYAKTAMEKAVKHGISDGSNPKSHCTREQVIVMLDRAGIL